MKRNEWSDDGTVALVRPYAMVRGRTHSRHNIFDLVTFVMSVVASIRDWQYVEPEHEAVLELCREPLSVSELVSRTGLPLGVVRVLLGDLLDMGAIRVSNSSHSDGRPGVDLIREVLAGLRAL
ncbi:MULTISPECIES: DUF742 domain-containing protein [Streptomyces]|uniref:DUF742 domain-containing protein n=1 Tax=Streptomyces canarius TaxID=285453 RepID=A0ABQ3DFW3_9ACTN|nr:DUF742 domain-containing protein [Streptomyces canarius]GHA77206.1 hypothetical protein GCM10010345_93690 [Streptomyces canarius]